MKWTKDIMRTYTSYNTHENANHAIDGLQFYFHFFSFFFIGRVTFIQYIRQHQVAS